MPSIVRKVQRRNNQRLASLSSEFKVPTTSKTPWSSKRRSGFSVKHLRASKGSPLHSPELRKSFAGRLKSWRKDRA